MTEGLLILIVGVIGVVGNGVSLWTFWRQRVHRIFHNLLLVLAIFDIVSPVESDLFRFSSTFFRDKLCVLCRVNFWQFGPFCE